MVKIAGDRILISMIYVKAEYARSAMTTVRQYGGGEGK